MPVDLKTCRQTFRKLDRQILKLGKDGSAANIHNFRTSSRRVETILEEFCPDLDRNTRKLLKMLSLLRKKVGKLRDLEVQTASLKNLKITRELGHKGQLIRGMNAENVKRKRKFFKVFDEETQRELRKRLKRVSEDFKAPANLEPVRIALRNFAPFGRQHSPLTQHTLHRYRIAGKKARYIAELGGNDPKAKQLVADLKRMQDVIGDWHDWMQLSEKGAGMFGEEKNSALVAALRNIARAKFRNSLNVLSETRQKLSAETKAANPGVARKPPVPAAPTDAAAAA